MSLDTNSQPHHHHPANIHGNNLSIVSVCQAANSFLLLPRFLKAISSASFPEN